MNKYDKLEEIKEYIHSEVVIHICNSIVTLNDALSSAECIIESLPYEMVEQIEEFSFEFYVNNEDEDELENDLDDDCPVLPIIILEYDDIIEELLIDCKYNGSMYSTFDAIWKEYKS